MSKPLEDQEAASLAFSPPQAPPSRFPRLLAGPGPRVIAPKYLFLNINWMLLAFALHLMALFKARNIAHWDHDSRWLTGRVSPSLSD